MLLLSNLAPIDASFNRLQPQTLLACSPAPFAESNVVNVLWKLGLSLLALVVTQNFAKRAANERAAHPPVATLGCPCSPDLPQALRLLRFFFLPFWGICFLSVLCEGWPSLFAAMWKSGRASWSRWPTDGCIHGRLLPNCVIWDLEFAQKISCFFLTGWCIRRKNGGHDYILKSFILVQMAFFSFKIPPLLPADNNKFNQYSRIGKRPIHHTYIHHSPIQHPKFAKKKLQI